MFTYGFGLRCVDAIRPMEGLELQCRDKVYFEELCKADVIVYYKDEFIERAKLDCNV